MRHTGLDEPIPVTPAIEAVITTAPGCGAASSRLRQARTIWKAPTTFTE